MAKLKTLSGTTTIHLIAVESLVVRDEMKTALIYVPYYAILVLALRAHQMLSGSVSVGKKVK